MDTLQKAMIDGIRVYYKAAFWSADIIQEQMKKFWTMLLEQNGKVRNEMESLFNTWATNLKRSREDLQRDMEKSLGMLEEGAARANGGLWALGAEAFRPWMEAQGEMMRNWMGIWGFPPAPAAPKGKGEEAGESASKSK